ncbi:hypothetical protein E5288_WYG019742 [Bos mutus]|uniref:Uncharacterized protein n=1 Tax=Bos mutus TaxID=72004 RepID=A0A6B0SI97_9CETA|nr:hypothetical protein [Bos mutus]
MPELGELTPRAPGSEARGSRRFREARVPDAERGPGEDGCWPGPRAPAWGPRSRDTVRLGPRLRSLNLLYLLWAVGPEEPLLRPPGPDPGGALTARHVPITGH